jgi:hypothetical protein
MRLSVRMSPESELVRQGLENLGAELPKIGRRRIYTMMNRIRRRLAVYPSEPSGQSVTSSHAVLGRVFSRAKGRYQRTGRYGRSWKVERLDDGYGLSNRAAFRGHEYAQYVGGDAYGQGQAWMHKGRWPLMRDVVDDELAKLPPEVEEEIVTVARRNGLEASNG